jgi:hypothetical protein
MKAKPIIGKYPSSAKERFASLLSSKPLEDEEFERGSAPVTSKRRQRFSQLLAAPKGKALQSHI